jgi:hypothetical protein
LEACVRAGVPFTATVIRWPLHDDTPEAREAYEREVAQLDAISRQSQAGWDRAMDGAFDEWEAEEVRDAQSAAKRQKLVDDKLRRAGRGPGLMSRHKNFLCWADR